MSRGVVLGSAALLAIALGAIALRESPRPTSPVPAEGGRTAGDDLARGPAAGPRGARRAVGRSGEEALPARPASLRGTRVDGALVTDAEGRFVPTPDARRLFDYYLAASGEEPEEVIVARIRLEIDRRLGPGPASEAHALLDRYLAYRARAREYAESGGREADLEERLAAIRAIRADTLGDEVAAAFFADEEEVDRAALERLRLASREELPADERERSAAALEAELPAAERARRREARVALDLRRAEAEVLEAGGSPEEVRALRESTVGPAAAARLAALDRRRAEWQGRLDSYRAAWAAIEADASLDAAARARAIEQLLAERFSETERLRVEALAPRGAD